jgi:hypothetical protein
VWQFSENPDRLFEVWSHQRVVCRVAPKLVPELSSFHPSLLVEIRDLLLVFAMPTLEKLICNGCRAIKRIQPVIISDDSDNEGPDPTILYEEDDMFPTLAQAAFGDELFISIESTLRDTRNKFVRTYPDQRVEWLVTICGCHDI